MARKDYFEYANYLLGVVSSWDRYDPNFKVRGQTKAQVAAQYQELDDLNLEISRLKSQLGLKIGHRIQICQQIDQFESHFRMALLGFYERDDAMVKDRPRLRKRSVGRPRKAIVTRRTNALKKKEAAQKAAADIT